MSRGLGRIERAVLAEVREGHDPDRVIPRLTTRALAARLFGPEPTQAQLVSFRRALRSLHRKGLVTIRRSWIWRGGRRIDLVDPSLSRTR